MTITQQDLDRYLAPRQGGNAPTLVLPTPAPVQAAQVTTPMQDASRQAAEDTFERDQELAATPLSKSLTAAVQNWDTTQLFNAAFNKPTFKEDPQFKKDEALQNVDVPISEDQRDFLFKSNSQEEFNWRVDQVKQMQERHQLASASPVLNTVVQFADPLYLAADLLSAGAATAVKAGRLTSAALGAVATAGIQTAVNQQVRPVSYEEVIMAAAMHGAASAIGYRTPAKSLADMSPEEFAAEMARRNGAAGPIDPNLAGSPLAMAGTFGVRTAPEVIDEVPAAIQQVAKEGYDNARAGVVSQPKRPWAELSLYKTMSNYGEAGRAVAARLLDDPLNASQKSVASIHREVSTRFSMGLHQYEDSMLSALKDQGWGTTKRFIDPQGFRRAQQDFEHQVRMELDQRMVNPAYRGGNPAVATATDRLGEYSRMVGRELESRGMVDKGFVDQNPYYYPRRMNVTSIERMEAAVGKKEFMKQMTTAVQRGLNSADRQTSNAIAYAMVERARRKGYGIDNSGAIINQEGRQELLDIIKQAPDLTDAAKARASALLTPQGDDAGRAAMLKTRINIDMMHEIAPGMQVRDLFDDSISSMMDSYNRRISGRIALHADGLGEPGAIEAMRSKLAQGISNQVERRKALDNFDNIVKYYQGQPVGESMPEFMRSLSALTQATGLASSGLWQLVEYGTMMQRYGAVKTFRAMLRAVPESRALMQQMRASTKEGKALALDVEEALTAQVAGEIRMRPVMDHYDDMFAADKSPWMMRMESARDMTMFVNMQKYIHFHQTRVNAALVTQTLRKAAEGDAAAAKAMRSYGMDTATLNEIKGQFAKHGNKLDNWDEEPFRKARTSMINAMDDAVVRARLGELPAFAEFSTLGKFLFTFRRFVAATHNKTLVGTMTKDGARGLATLMAYQFPLAMMATAANNVISGKGFDEKKPFVSLAGQAINYMGAIGFASEFTGVLSGQQRSFGAPGLLFLDRVYGIGNNVAAAGRHAVTGDVDKVGDDLRQATGNTMAAIPLLSIVPGVRALTNAVKDQ
ncbi:hypothetical protein [Pantoea phage LIMEzero]|uniref:Internal virion protein n=1 Tax=Pantoea phage LIMEzero TaxID=943335 RepID=F4N9U8_9CAUD|nr:internal virion protein with endolysin domain [Pantoea phage LIMEzero]CBY88576.1 hypothetical protein [Pantoea phage LIMEzero]